jgi:DeoR/GlpR family transcriptional regulator of sugar metabolism
MTNEIKKEASRLLGNMSSMAGYHGTCSAAVADYIAENYSMTVFCNGYLRNIVFAPATRNHYSFKTEAAWAQLNN